MTDRYSKFRCARGAGNLDSDRCHCPSCDLLCGLDKSGKISVAKKQTPQRSIVNISTQSNCEEHKHKNNYNVTNLQDEPRQQLQQQQQQQQQQQRKRMLVIENVPKSMSPASGRHYYHRCQNQRSHNQFHHTHHFRHTKKLCTKSSADNMLNHTHHNHHHSIKRLPASRSNYQQHPSISRFYLVKIALIYIVFTSIAAVTNLLLQHSYQPLTVSLCSATHHRFVGTSNFYWPTSILNQPQQYVAPSQQQITSNKNSQQTPRTVHIRSNFIGSNRRSLSSSASAAAAAAAAALATANAALARRGQSYNLMIGQSFNNFSSAVPYSVMMQDVDYSSSQEDPIINEPAPSGYVKPLDLQQGRDQASSNEQHWSSNQLRSPNSVHNEVPSLHQQNQQKQQQTNPKDELPESLAGVHHDGLDNESQFEAGPASLAANTTSIIEALLQHGQRLIQATNHDTSQSNDKQASYDSSRQGTKTANDRALLPIDSTRLMLPQMQQIKARFNQGCVGGTKCQFFAFCWMSGGSLGASCGLLMTCCVTPSRQEIQPGFYGPVVNDPYCGRSTSKINRIVGGTDASFGQFPWQAFVQVGGSRCGGALISSRHVVTAGHCVARSQHSPSSIKVTLGDYILNSDIESIPHEVFSVVEVLLHPNFRFTPQADRYDVAVLELDRAASYKDNIKPICLPQKDAAFVGRVAYVAGWGALQAGSKLRPKVLQHVAVPVIENHVCESWHRRKGIDIRIYDEMMCAGYELGQRDACQGDSGGPLMLNQFGVWYLVGIVSAGYSCAKQYQPGIYHRVSSSSDWISSNVYQQGSSK